MHYCWNFVKIWGVENVVRKLSHVFIRSSSADLSKGASRDPKLALFFPTGIADLSPGFLLNFSCFFFSHFDALPNLDFVKTAHIVMIMDDVTFLGSVAKGVFHGDILV